MFLGKVGKTTEYRELIRALRGVLTELDNNTALHSHASKVLGKKYPTGLRYGTYRLARLLETENVPEDIRSSAQDLYGALDIVNTFLFAAPILEAIVGRAKVPIVGDWDSRKPHIDAGCADLKKRIEQHLDSISRRKPAV